MPTTIASLNLDGNHCLLAPNKESMGHTVNATTAPTPVPRAVPKTRITEALLSVHRRNPIVTLRHTPIAILITLPKYGAKTKPNMMPKIRAVVVERAVWMDLVGDSVVTDLKLIEKVLALKFQVTKCPTDTGAATAITIIVNNEAVSTKAFIAMYPTTEPHAIPKEKHIDTFVSKRILGTIATPHEFKRTKVIVVPWEAVSWAKSILLRIKMSRSKIDANTAMMILNKTRSRKTIKTLNSKLSQN